MKSIDELIKELNLDKKLVEIRRGFHKHPELSGNEYMTMDKICQYLDKWGIKYTKGVADTGVVAIIEGTSHGKTVGLRGDIDALPIEEENKNTPYCSQNPGVMHACGHEDRKSTRLNSSH